MGWFDGRSSTSSSRHVRRRSQSRRSVYSTSHSRHSAPSIFSLGGYSRAGRSSPSVLSSSSSRRARPRAGFIQRVIHYIKRLFRDIYNYARRHPAKVLFMVIIPLLTSGVLQKLLAMIGIRLPHSLGGHSSRARRVSESGMSDNLNGLMNIAKMFL
ncbi:hypothetical protein KXX33_004842 [Aspergillus fumigatus]|nr:hypothetical protein KXX33_004842 [Aspergillus fumigatus]KAH1463705.1 hypothetical protein KXX53_002940 [Aspergillus fumigatus]KAH1529146.1 hypothetical protein KXX61_004874 [Aspergillus fumigatus]KAH1632861.1 hypothetical protein KXX59_005617 [Aspergillus fumigatus]KAH1779952.1 hypothetical protein KXX62_008895 [Aspergillus fumigatus]